MCTPTTGSPTITLFQLRSNYHTIFNSQINQTFIGIYNCERMLLLSTRFNKQLTLSKKLVATNMLTKFTLEKRGSVQLARLFERDGRCVQSLTDHSP